MSDIFRTVYSSTYNMAQQKLARQEQMRREAQQRRDMLNTQTNQALLGTLAAVGQMQDRNFQRQAALSQAAGKATGTPLQGEGITPGMEAYSRVGAAERGQEENKLAQDASTRQALANLQQRGQMQQMLAKEQLLRERERQDFERNRPFKEAAQKAKDLTARASMLRAKAADAGKLGTKVMVGGAQEGGVNPNFTLAPASLRELNEKKIKLEGTVDRLKAIRARIVDNPQSFQVAERVKAAAGDFAEQWGFGGVFSNAVQNVNTLGGMLTLEAMATLKPYFGVLSDTEQKKVAEVLGSIGTAGPTKALAQLDSLTKSVGREAAFITDVIGRGTSQKLPAKAPQFSPERAAAAEEIRQQYQNGTITRAQAQNALLALERAQKAEQ